jgi:uncharacterized protein YndB with AHSA1/START domain
MAAPADAVYRAWTDPVFAARWSWGKKYEKISIDLDCRAGGTWRQHIRDKETGENWFFEGVFREVAPDKRLLHTFHFRSDRGVDHGKSLVVIEFNAKGDRTEVVITHSQLPDEQTKRGTEAGWVDVLECVERVVEEATSADGRRERNTA